jgi:hypothetical protein
MTKGKVVRVTADQNGDLLNVILPSRSPEWYLLFRIYDLSFVYIFYLSHVCYMSRLFYPTESNHPNNVR